MLYPNWQEAMTATVRPVKRGAVPRLEPYAHLEGMGLDIMVEIPVFYRKDEKEKTKKRREMWKTAAIFAGILQEQNPKKKIVLMHRPAEVSGFYHFGGECFYITEEAAEREGVGC